VSDLKPFPIVNDWAKGCYVARVTGTHPKYVFEREFVNGTPIKSRGTLEYLPGRDLPADSLPAWYVVRDRYQTDQLLDVGELGYRIVGEHLTAVEVREVFTHGLPGESGCWDGARCECGALAFPGEDCVECDEMERIKTANAGAPVEVPF